MATTAQLSGNSHPGFEGINAALCLAEMEANSNPAPGMAACLRRNGTRSRCSGKERDAESGLDYFLARYYSGAQGRFTSVDPDIDLAFHVSDPQGWNGYAYARNNPLRFVDPDGRDYRVCAIDENGKEFNCGTVTDDRAFEEYAQKMGWTIERGKLIDREGNVHGSAHWFDPQAMETLSLAGKLAAPAAEVLTAGLKVFGYIAAPAATAIADYVSGADRSNSNLAMAVIPGLEDVLVGARLLRAGKGLHTAEMLEKSGGFSAAVEDLEKLQGGSTKTVGQMKIKTWPDGSSATARPFSTTDGRPTLQINHASGAKTEIRYNR